MQFCPNLSPSHDFDDFQTVARMELALRKLRGGYRLAVEFNNNAARQEILLEQEMLERAGQVCRRWLSIRDDVRSV
jgi:hypothetical protein